MLTLSGQLLELMNDRTLLPFILPNVFVISQNLSSIEFTSNVLPRLKPLFSVQDPPQNQREWRCATCATHIANTSPQSSCSTRLSCS